MGDQESSIRLKALNVPGWGSPIEIPADGLIIGRDPSNDVVVASVDFPHVSSRHARISQVSGDYVITDLESKNGTLVDGRRVQNHRLRPGEIVQLGYRGPKFVVCTDDGIGEELDPTMLETVDARPSTVSLEREADTIVRVKQALGLPEGSNVEDLFRHRTQRTIWMSSVATICLVVLTWWIATAFSPHHPDLVLDEYFERRNEKVTQLQAQIVQFAAQLEEEILRLRKRLDAEETVNEAERVAILKDLERKQERLESLRDIREGRSTTRTTLELRGVRPAVAEVYMQVRFRQVGTEEYLCQDEMNRFNFAGRGPQQVYESGGTGVCISKRGEILTNAHVIEYQMPSFAAYDWNVEPEVSYRIRFVDESDQTHAARKKSSDAVVDLAILTIEPYPAMPVAEGFSTDVARPADGDEVSMLGFPSDAFQISRAVVTSWDEYMTLDCEVFPGASGSPIVDSQGRIVGIAKGRVESEDRRGVVIPIAEVAHVWSPE